MTGTSGTTEARPSGQYDPPQHIRPAPLVPVAICFIIGIILAESLGLAVQPLAVAGGVALACALAGMLLRRKIAAGLALLAAFTAAGAAVYSFRCTFTPPDHVGAFVSEERMMVRARVRVADEPMTTLKAPVALTPPHPDDLNYETGFQADIAQIIAPDSTRAVSGRIMVKIFDRNPGIRYGDELLLTGQLQAPNKPTNPSQFDYNDYLRKRGIRAIIYVKNAAGAQRTGHSRGGALRALFSVRNRLVSMLERVPDVTGRSVLAAMLLGADEELPPEVAEDFRRSGARHLLAVSGLHVGMIAALLWMLAALFRLPEWARSVILIVGVAGYVAITGARPPAMRAGVMIAVMALARPVARPHVILNTLALAALIVLIFAPGQVFMIGFQLSFVAVLSIVCFYGPVKSLLDRLRLRSEWEQFADQQPRLVRIWVMLKRTAFPALAVSLAATIGVMPLIARTFHIVSPVGAVANAVLVPLATLVVYLGLAGMLAAMILLAVWPGAWVMLMPAAGAARLLAYAAAAAARVPFSHFNTGGPPLWFIAAYYALLVAVVNRRRLGLTPRRLVVLSLLLLNGLALGAVWPTPSKLRMTAFDVRHGGCTVFHLPAGGTLMYDCGTSSRFFDPAAYVAAPALWERGVHTIDTLVLSHDDVDHISGVDSLVQLLRVGRVLHPLAFGGTRSGDILLERLDSHGIPRLEQSAGRVLETGGAVVEILGPPQSTQLQVGQDANNQSLVIRLTAAGKRFLLCGDIHTSGIAWLLVSGQDLRADVIFMPHHGSWYPNIPRLLDAVRPEAAVISCDRGYASLQTLAALSERNIRTLQTSETGAIDMTVTSGTLQIRTMLDGEFPAAP